MISDEQSNNVGLQVKKIMDKCDTKNLNVETFSEDLHNSLTQIIPSLPYINKENYNEKFDELINIIQKVFVIVVYGCLLTNYTLLKENTTHSYVKSIKEIY